MTSYQNMGKFDGGIFGGGAIPGGALPVMDEAGIASGQAFLVSELEKRDPLIRKPLSSITYPRDIPVSVGGKPDGRRPDGGKSKSGRRFQSGKPWRPGPKGGGR